MKQTESFLNNRYMLSVNDKKEVRRIRSPFLSKQQLDEFLFVYANNPNRYENLQIILEPTLNTIVTSENHYEPNSICTLREYMFGKFYQENVTEYESNENFRNFFDATNH